MFNGVLLYVGTNYYEIFLYRFWPADVGVSLIIFLVR